MLCICLFFGFHLPCLLSLISDPVVLVYASEEKGTYKNKLWQISSYVKVEPGTLGISVHGKLDGALDGKDLLRTVLNGQY